MPSWREGCSGLSAWPSVDQLSAAGFGDGVSWQSAVLGFGIAAGACIPAICQAVNFMRSRSVQGVSLFTVFFNVSTCIMQLTVAATASGPSLWLCPTLGLSGCFAASISLWQFCVQPVGPICLFILYMHLWKHESRATCRDANLDVIGVALTTEGSEAMCQASPTGNQKRSMCLGWLSFISVFAVSVAFALLPYIVGPCGSLIRFACDLAGALGTISTMCYLLPQMALLWRTGDRGTLSMGMLVVQAVGNSIQVVNFIIEGAPIAAVAPFAVQALECGIVFVMAIVMSRSGIRSVSTQ